MKYGINTLLWTTDLDETKYPLIENIKAWGYDAVEFAIFSYDLAHFQKLGSKFDELELERTAVAICTPDTNPISPDAAVRIAATDHLKRSVDVAHAAGCKILAGPFHSAIGMSSPSGPTKDELKYCADVLTQVADHAKEAGITLALEYLNRFECYIITCATDLVRFVKDINHPNLKLMYDTFHANIEEKDVAQAIRDSAELCIHFHIAENDRSTPGKGSVDWATTFSTLKEINYNGMLTIEAFGQAIPAMVSSMHIWRKMYPSEEYLAKNGIAFMKSMWENV
jgi:D-psicose/D-tagatose/L-ribulose 3-epimerase